MKKFLTSVLLATVAVLFCGCSDSQKDSKLVIKMGFFPNVTHAQGVIAYELSQQNNGWFEKYLGDDVKIKWNIFNAGPSAMTSLFSGALDLTYVGPNPAINSYIKSAGREIRVLAGSADGGSGLVVSPKVNYKDASSLKGKVIATPQYANTQDVACKTWVINNSLKINNGAGGDVKVLPVGNPDQLPLLNAGEIDAAWTVEPWISVLENGANAKLVISEKDSVTTILVSSVDFMKENPEVVEKLRKAHIELTDWINKNPEEAKKLVLQGLKRLRKSNFSEDIINKSFSRITFTSKVNKTGIEQFVEDAKKCGFIKSKIDMADFFSAAEPKSSN